MIIRPRNWKSFQHYSTRKPAWIKLHRELLDNFEFQRLHDASRALAPMLWLLASESKDATIDADPEKLAFRLRRTPKEIVDALTPLISSGFFEVVQDASKPLAGNHDLGVSEEERETEEEREKDKNSVEPSSTDVVPREANASDSVARVFAHWRETHGHQRARLDAKRRKLIHAALKNYSEADLCQSITGYLNSPHHMGQNDRNTKFDDIELFLRDAKHIDAGLRFHAQPPRTDQSAKTRSGLARVADWTPPEMRRAAS